MRKNNYRKMYWLLALLLASNMVISSKALAQYPIGNGLAFDGVNDYVSLPTGIMSNFSANRITIEGWFYNTYSSYDHMQLIGQGYINGNNIPFFLEMNGTKVNAGMYIDGFYNTTQVTIPLNTWTHIAGTYDGTAISLYINGSLASSLSRTGNMGTNSNPWYLGRRWDDPNQIFHGKMDEVRIWNVARTATQIADGMSCDILPQTGLLAYYRFDQGTANANNTAITSLSDYSGHGYSGTFNNFTLSGTTSNFVAGKISNCNTINFFSGNTTVCQGSTTTLSNSEGAGTWSSGNIGVATIGATSGVVTGIAGGTATISYNMAGSTSTTTVTVNGLPSAGGTITTVAGGGTGVGDNGPATTAELPGFYGTLHALTTDASGNFYVGELSGRVRKVDAATGIITTICGGGGGTSDGGAATNANLGFPSGLAIDASGNLYVSDAYAGRIYKVTTSGNIYTFAGTGSSTFNGDGMQATATTFNNPSGLAIDASGNLIVADMLNYRIRKISTSGIVSTIAGTGTMGYSGDGGPGSSAQIFQPRFLAINSAGEICFGDQNYSDNTNFRVRKISTSGIISTFAGDGSRSYSGDGGPATAASLNNTMGMTFDAAGNLLIADNANYRIRKVTPSGVISTLYGTGSASSGDGGPATAAGMRPAGITFDASGNLYLCDGQQVRKVSAGNLINNITGNANACLGSNTTLADASAGGTWSSSNTAVATVGSTGVVTAIAAGTATITYTLTRCITERATRIVTVSTTNVSSANAEVCAGFSTSLSASGGTTYSWAPATGLSATTGATVSTSPSATTTYTITGTSAAGCSGTTTATVVVNDLPTISVNDATICPGTSGTLTAGGAASYSWLPATDLSSATAASVSASPSGTTTYTVTGTTAAGCTNTAVATVIVRPATDAGTITGATFVTLGSTIILSNATGDGIWSSSNTGAATVNASGTVTGIALGNTVISYAVTGICGTAITTYNVTVTSGSSATVCVGSTTTLALLPTGGTWSSSNTTIATIGSSTGIVSGIAAGAVNVTYTAPLGATSVIAVTVNALPATITGTTSACAGSTLTLVDATTGGAWSSASSAIATAAPTGVISGNAAGTTTISYTLATGCATTRVVTINASPSAISGTTTICVGATTTLGNMVAGGTWGSSFSTKISVNASTGITTGVGAGTATVTYTLPGSCRITADMTVNAVPAAITGTTKACPGTSTTLADATTGGSWSTANTDIATVDAMTGVVTGVTAGNAIITYATGAGCTKTTIVTINPAPATISGNSTVCAGATTPLTDATTGGLSWTSSATGIATVNSTSGVVTGVAPGNVNITYTVSTGCISVKAMTVSALPAAIGGTLKVCKGATTALSNSVTDGTWTSNNTATATIDAATGVATGVAAGTVVITYTLGTGCTKTAILTVNPVPAAITGTTTACSGTTATLSTTTTGGTWSSNTTGVATVSGGIVTGITAGTATISYTLSTGCYDTAVVNITSGPAAISGSLSACIATITTLTDATAAGTWSSSNTAVATIGAATGLLTGVAAGTANVTYKLSGGCLVKAIVTVNALPAAITGTAGVCVGTTTTLSSTTTGGTWSSDNMTTATVGSTGIVTGAAAGNTTITYTAATGCMVTKAVTVNSLAAIAGTQSLCTGATTTLSNATTSGTWSSSNTAIATVGATTGIVSGAAAGTATISYSLATGCRLTAVVTVSAVPVAITGVAATCEGGGITNLSDVTAGGTWSSADNMIATVGTAGAVTGVAAGNVNISYVTGTGCYAVKAFTVYPAPAAITGTTSACAGNTATLANTGSGSWSSSFTSIVSVGASTGVVTGLASGTAIVTFTSAAGCKTTTGFTVNAAPATITGTLKACPGTTTTLGNTVTGGAWSTTDVSIATVDATTGVVTGGTTGVAVITYSSGAGCIRTAAVTINPQPAAIYGTASVCVSGTTALFDSTAGGLSWSSSDASTATVNPTSGIVSGIAPGNATITYTLSTGCIATIIVTVNGVPAAITGTLSVCAGSATALSNSVADGTWATSNTAVATTGTNGVVTGVAAGTSVVSYTSGTGCYTTAIITVNTTPAAIAGTASVCTGNITTLSTTATGGAWSSDNAMIASVSGGIVTGAAAGIANVSYTMPSGCYAAASVTVNALPSAITGATGVCIGSSAILGSTPASGTWTSNNTMVATIDAATGEATGVAAGNANISYTLPTGCMISRTLTVNAAPSAISGIPGVCVGTTATLSSMPPGGTWMSSDIMTATVNASGVVTGIAIGNASITYTTAAGCTTSTIVTVNTLSPVTGTATVCAGNTTALANVTPGGTWSSSNATTATVGTTGIVTGIAPGTATVAYTLPSGCSAAVIVTVNAVPSSITGASVVCAGAITTVSDATTGGTWSSTDGLTTVDAMTGAVTGTMAGNAIVSYTIGTGCYTVKTITVNPLPATIGGTTNVCIGLTTTLTSTAGGTWSGSNASVVSVGASTGIMTGVAAGTAAISYTLPTGCKTATAFTVNPAPANIAGTMKACPGTTTTLTNTTTGGAWSTTDAAIASVDATTGVVTGISSGLATITYNTGASCAKTAVVTINPIPAAISGTLVICTGSTTALTDPTTGGLSWTSSNTAVATINATSGVASGLSVGVTTITYTLSTGCYITAALSINALPANVGGTLKVCTGATTALTSGSGTWTSSNTSVATIATATGIATGVAAGTTTITYSEGAGCTRTAVLTVNPVPTAILGTGVTCISTTTTLSDATTGGTWASNNTGVATIGSATGIISGVSAGNATITYTLANGCTATKMASINAAPAASTGATALCTNATTTFSNTTMGGTWASSNPGIATIGSATGVVTTLSSTGTVNITYSLGATCRTINTFTINATPPVITGTATVCGGAVTTLASGASGGTWSSTNTAIGTIGSISSSSARFVALTNGTTTVSYTFASGCARTTVVTVNAPVAGTITSASGFNINTVSMPTSVTLSSTGDAGGAWTSNNTSVATIGAATGVVNSAGAGTALISYTVTLSGCTARATHTVSVTAARANNNTAATAPTENELGLYPNPNNGSFNIKGTMEMEGNQDLTIEIMDMAGQIIYSNKSAVKEGKVNEAIVLNNTLVNGMYIMHVRTADSDKVIHFVVAR